MIKKFCIKKSNWLRSVSLRTLIAKQVMSYRNYSHKNEDITNWLSDRSSVPGEEAIIPLERPNVRLPTIYDRYTLWVAENRELNQENEEENNRVWKNKIKIIAWHWLRLACTESVLAIFFTLECSHGFTMSRDTDLGFKRTACTVFFFSVNTERDSIFKYYVMYLYIWTQISCRYFKTKFLLVTLGGIFVILPWKIFVFIYAQTDVVIVSPVKFIFFIFLIFSLCYRESFVIVKFSRFSGQNTQKSLKCLEKWLRKECPDLCKCVWVY